MRAIDAQSRSPLRGVLYALILSVIAFASACRTTNENLRVRMESYDPAERIRALTAAARQDRVDLIPAMVDRLDDDDIAVRMFAILSLEKLTGTRRGYAYYDPAYKRRAAIEAWRRYVTESAQAEADVSTALAKP